MCVRNIRGLDEIDPSWSLILLYSEDTNPMINQLNLNRFSLIGPSRIELVYLISLLSFSLGRPDLLSFVGTTFTGYPKSFILGLPLEIDDCHQVPTFYQYFTPKINMRVLL